LVAGKVPVGAAIVSRMAASVALEASFVWRLQGERGVAVRYQADGS